jgi:cyclase
LLLRGTGLVKTVRFANAAYIGDPINAVRIFNEKEVDELFIFDITASKNGRGPNFTLLEQVVSEAFMPVAYGGGIRTMDEARRLISIGVEKLAINTAAMTRPHIISELAERFGSQCVVGVVDVKKRWLSGYTVYSHAGVKPRETDPILWMQQLIMLGAGEILVQSVDRDGTMAGYDLDLLNSIDGRFTVPIVAAGGAGNVDHMIEALRTCRLSALAVGARFVYRGPHRAVLINYLDSEELARIQTARVMAC